jgi:hypothetical protein
VGKAKLPRSITPRELAHAKGQCSAPCVLGKPNEWDSWFPQLIPLRLNKSVTLITARHIQEYAKARLDDVDDPHRFVEAAQCLTLLHVLGSPSPDTVITSTHG